MNVKDEESSPEVPPEGPTSRLASVLAAADSILPTLDQLSETSTTITVISNAIRLSNLLNLSAWTQDKQMSEGITRAYADMKYLMGLLVYVTLLSLQLGLILFYRLCQSKGLSERSQFKLLMDEAMGDVKSCHACCEAYLKKSGAVRVIKRNLWREALARYTARIQQQRRDIMNLLLMHAAVSGVDVTVAEYVRSIWSECSLTFDRAGDSIEREMQEELKNGTDLITTINPEGFAPVSAADNAKPKTPTVIGPSDVQSEAVEAAHTTGPSTELSPISLRQGKDVADLVRDISLGVAQEDELSRYPKDVVQNVLDAIQQVGYITRL